MKLMQSSIWMLGGRGANIVISFITGILLARYLGPELRGELAISIIWIGVSSIITTLGVPEGIIYLIQQVDESIDEYRNKIFSSGLVVVSIIPLLIFIGYLTYGYKHNIQEEYILIIIGIIVISIGTFFRHIVMANQKFKIYTIAVTLEVVIYLLLVITAIQYNLGVLHIVACYIFSLLISMIYLSLKIRYEYKFSLKYIKLSDIKNILKYSFNIYIVSIAGYAENKFVYIIIERFINAKILGIYTVCSTLPNLLVQFPQQMSTVFYSYFSKYKRKLKNYYYIDVIQIITIASVLFSIPLLLYPDYIITKIYGSEYSGYGTVTILLTLIGILNGVKGLIYNLLLSIGNSKYGRNVMIFGLIYIFTVVTFSTYYYGLYGALISKLIFAIAILILLSNRLLKDLEVNYRTLLVPNRLKEKLSILKNVK